MEQHAGDQSKSKRKAYRPPTLSCHGSLGELTQSAGSMDTGGTPLSG